MYILAIRIIKTMIKSISYLDVTLIVVFLLNIISTQTYASNVTVHYFSIPCLTLLDFFFTNIVSLFSSIN